MTELYKPYQTVQFISEVKTNIVFDEMMISKGYEFVFWQMSEVKYITDADTALQYYRTNKDYILNIRIFNEDEEFYFWKSGNQQTGRHRKDAESHQGEDYAIDTEMLLRSVIAPEKSGKAEDKYFLKTRNYLANDGFGYNDSRFVAITSKK